MEFPAAVVPHPVAPQPLVLLRQQAPRLQLLQLAELPLVAAGVVVAVDVAAAR